MNGHLRADAIRLGRRWDVWLIAAAVLGLAALGFVQGYGDIPNHYGWDPSQPIPPEVIAAMDAERATYAFPDSLLRLIGSAPWLLVAIFFLTSLTLGLEFGWGTIRTVLLASSDRRRFLVSRLLALAAVGLMLFAGLLLLGAVLPEVLVATGARLPPSPEVVPVEVLGAIAAWVVALAFVLAMAALLAIVTRNPALPFLVAIVWFILESLVANLPPWRDLHLEQVAHSLPFSSVAALLADSLDPAHYGLAVAGGFGLQGAGSVDPGVTAGAVDRPLLFSFAVVIGWAILGLLAAATLIRRADILE